MIAQRLPCLIGMTASALLASLGTGHDFKNGRQVTAWIGLVPGHYSSGGKTRMGRITKAGDGYLRSRLVERRGYWKAVVAIAAKNARLARAVLHYGEDFRPNPGAV